MTTRVRFIDSAATSSTQYVRGKSYDVDPAFGAAMIAAGAAVADEPASPVVVPPPEQDRGTDTVPAAPAPVATADVPPPAKAAKKGGKGRAVDRNHATD